MGKTEMILTVGEKRALMPKKYYDSISSFIIGVLEKEVDVPLIELIERIESVFEDELVGNLSWYLIHVKQDLHARGIIKIIHEVDRQQWISLKKNYRQKLNRFGLNFLSFDKTRVNISRRFRHFFAHELGD